MSPINILENRSMITFAIDFVDPESYLAFRPTIRLAEELQVDLDVVPYRLMARSVPKPHSGGEETVGERHTRVRANYRKTNLRRYFARQGLSSRETSGIDSTPALEGLLKARQAKKGIQYASAVFDRFWSNSIDLSLDSVAEVLDQLCIGDESFEDLLVCRERLTNLGVFSAPMYVVADQLFMGRQHLPMIRWILTGQNGVPPL